MSLTQKQKENTKNEFYENFNLTGYSIETVANDLHTTPQKISCIMSLAVESIEEPWILKNYLIEQLEKQGKQPISFSALLGDHHRYYFLNTDKIDKRIL